MKNKVLLAVVGLPGAGKTEVVEYLMKKVPWPKVYFGQGVIDEVKRRSLEISEVNERTVREDLRKQYGMSAMAVVNLPKIKELFLSSSVILESLYSWEEYLEIKKNFGDDFKVLAVYASPADRIKRLSVRPFRALSKEEVVTRDYSQIENLHQAGPIARADFTILNTGALEDLYKQIDKLISNKL